MSKLEKNPDIQLIWATGSATYQDIINELERKGINWRLARWQIVEYLTKMPEALAVADLCLCRAGATTLAELSAAGKAAILIPYPYAAENHQEYNARVFEEKGAAEVIIDKELTGELLWERVAKIIFNNFKLEEMGKRSAEVFQAGALDRIIIFAGTLPGDKSFSHFCLLCITYAVEEGR